jgi:hypothetical protein
MLPWAEDDEDEDESCLDDCNQAWRGGDVHPQAQDIRSGWYWRTKVHDTVDIDALIKKVHAENVRDVRGGL